jgi:hypothetical protein
MPPQNTSQGYEQINFIPESGDKDQGVNVFSQKTEGFNSFTFGFACGLAVIESEMQAQFVCVAAFIPLRSKASNKKIKCAAYSQHLLTHGLDEIKILNITS